jgi:hypothetical protein
MSVVYQPLSKTYVALWFNSLLEISHLPADADMTLAEHGLYRVSKCFPRPDLNPFKHGLVSHATHCVDLKCVGLVGGRPLQVTEMLAFSSEKEECADLAGSTDSASSVSSSIDAVSVEEMPC